MTVPVDPNAWADHLFAWGKARRAKSHEAVPRPTPERPTPQLDDDDETPRAITNPQAYARRALDSAVDNVRTSSEGFRNHTLNAAAYSLGRLVGASLLDEATVVDTLTTAADECGLDPSEIPATISSGLYAGMGRPVRWVQAPAEHVPLVRPAESTSHPSAVAVVDDEQLMSNELRLQRARRAAAKVLDAEERAARFVDPGDGWRGDTFVAEQDEPEIWLFEDVLPYGANVTLTAPYKTGKTTFMANVLAALLDREALAGRWELRSDPGRVAVWDFEMTRRQYRRWLKALGAQHLERLSGHTLRGQALDLLTDEGTAWAIGWLAARRIGVLVVDPFARAFKDDENDNALVTKWTDNLDVIKEQSGVHTLIMPVHTGRREGDDMRARGATRLDDWPDVRWLLRKDAETERRSFEAHGRDVAVPRYLLSYDELTRRYRVDDKPAAESTLDAQALAIFDELPVYLGPGCAGMSQAKALDLLDLGRGKGNVTKLRNILHALAALKGSAVQLHTPENGTWHLFRTVE